MRMGRQRRGREPACWKWLDRTCRFSSQCGQNHSPFGAASKGGVRQKVWYALLHASPSHSSIRIAPSRRPHFLHAASSSSLLASGPSSAAAAAATCCCGGSGFRAGAGAEAAAAGCAAGAVAFARGSLGLAVDLGGDAFVDFLFFFADGPAQSPGGLFACATFSALRRRRGPAGGGKTQEPKCLSANIQPLIPHTS